MGRSSIIFISFLLSVDYGLRISTYMNLGRTVVETLTCRLAETWFSNSKLYVELINQFAVPLIILIVSLPLALMTTVRHLKYYARLLFFL